MTNWRTLAIPSQLDEIIEEIKKRKKIKSKWQVVEKAIRAYISQDQDQFNRFVMDIQRVFELYNLPYPNNLNPFFRKLFEVLKSPGFSYEEANFKIAILIDVLKGDYSLLNKVNDVKQDSLTPEEIEKEKEDIEELKEEEEGEINGYEVIDENNEEEILEEESQKLLEELKKLAEAGDKEAKLLLALYESTKDQAQAEEEQP